MGKSEDKKKEKVLKAGIVGAQADIVQRYGSAAKEHFVVYSGVDHENGTQLKRSLKSISKSKVNPDYQQQNYKQQAGFSAEVKETANYNAESHIKGTGNRKVRTDDIGRVNDPLYDHVILDSNGNVITGSGSQMKFVGNTPEEALDKLASNKFSKYLDNDVAIEVPADYYNRMMSEADKRIAELEKQIAYQNQNGNTEQAELLKKRLQDYKKIKKNLQKSSVSNKEAMFARKHPGLSTAKSVADIAHRAGTESAKNSFVIGGSISLVRNFVSTVKGECELEEAAQNMLQDTAEAVKTGYITGASGAVIKAGMQNSTSTYVRALSKTNLPATLVQVTMSVKNTMESYFKGEMDEVECLEQLGQEGTGMLGSALFATIGQVAIPIPVVGGLIGGMLGYAVSTASYGILTSSLKEAKLAREERIRIERECEEHIKLIREYRAELEKTIQTYLVSHTQMFHETFSEMKRTLNVGDIDGFISETNKITEAFGKKPLFSNFEEFDALMMSDEVIKI